MNFSVDLPLENGEHLRSQRRILAILVSGGYDYEELEIAWVFMVSRTLLHLRPN